MGFYRCSAEKESETRMWDGFSNRYLEKYENLHILSTGQHATRTNFRSARVLTPYENSDAALGIINYISPWEYGGGQVILTTRNRLNISGCAYAHSYLLALKNLLGFDPILEISEVVYDSVNKQIKEIMTDSINLRIVNESNIYIPFGGNRDNNQIYSVSDPSSILLYEKFVLLGFPFATTPGTYTVGLQTIKGYYDDVKDNIKIDSLV